MSQYKWTREIPLFWDVDLIPVNVFSPKKMQYSRTFWHSTTMTVASCYKLCVGINRLLLAASLQTFQVVKVVLNVKSGVCYLLLVAGFESQTAASITMLYLVVWLPSTVWCGYYFKRAACEHCMQCFLKVTLSTLSVLKTILVILKPLSDTFCQSCYIVTKTWVTVTCSYIQCPRALCLVC